MRAVIIALALGASAGCGLIEHTADRLDSSQAEAVCADSCDRQHECDASFDVAACKGKCSASVAAWYLCPDAPDIADYIEMCNGLACDQVESCLNDRPDC